MIALGITCVINIASCRDTASDIIKEASHHDTTKADEDNNTDNSDNTAGSLVRDEPYGEHRFSDSDDPTYAWYDNVLANYSVKVAKEWRVEHIATNEVVFAGNAIWWSQNTNGVANDPFEIEITYIAHPDNDTYGDWAESLVAETETETETVTVKGLEIDLHVIDHPTWVYTRCAYIVISDNGVVRIELRYGKKNPRRSEVISDHGANRDTSRDAYHPSPKTLNDFYTTLRSVQELVPT